MSRKNNLMTSSQNLWPKFIAGGDFNSKHTIWGARLTITKGRELAKVLQENNYIFLSTGSPHLLAF
jgi:hypothetical protein